MTSYAVESAATSHHTAVTPSGRNQAIKATAAAYARAGVTIGPRKVHAIVRRWERSGRPLVTFLADTLHTERLPDGRALRGADPTGNTAVRNVMRGPR